MADLILMLNDDCFLEIFKYLSLIDLANFKDTYKSLGAVVDMEFTRKTKGSLEFCYPATIPDVLEITKQFGSSIVRLTISSKNWSEIFSAVGVHCTEKLKSLSVIGMGVERIKEADVSLIADVLKNIETLNINVHSRYSAFLGYGDGGSNEFFSILSHCKKAKSIELFHAMGMDLPQTIFQRNTNILMLKMRGWTNACYLKPIVENLMHTPLQELIVKAVDTDSIKGLLELLRLRNLKRLSVYCGYSNANDFVRNVDALDSLTRLSLSSVERLDETSIAKLGRMTRLTVLQLIECYFNTGFFETLVVLCENENLEHLRFLCQPMDVDAVDKVNFLKLIEKRKAAENCLHLTIWKPAYIASVEAITPELLESNKGTIKLIDIENCNYEYYRYE